MRQTKVYLRTRSKYTRFQFETEASLVINIICSKVFFAFQTNKDVKRKFIFAIQLVYGGLPTISKIIYLVQKKDIVFVLTFGR